MRVALLILALAACSPQPPSDQPPAPQAQGEQSQSPSAAPRLEQPSAQTNEERMAQMPSWETARAAGVDFRGVGQEPGWLIDIYQRERIRFLWDYGDSLADFPLTDPSYPQEGVTRYETQAAGRALVVTITRTPCQDGMSGQPYPARVDILIDGRALNGCGRSV